MKNSGKIIKKGLFHNKICGKGTVTLQEDMISIQCPWGRTSFNFKLYEINQFRTTKRGIYIDKFYLRLDNATEWIEAVKKALDAKGIKYEVIGYRVLRK
jgi:hypothetical protein